MSNSDQTAQLLVRRKTPSFTPAPFSTGAILALSKQPAIFSSLICQHYCPFGSRIVRSLRPNHRPTLLLGGAAWAPRQSVTNMHFLRRLSLLQGWIIWSEHTGLEIVLSGDSKTKVANQEKKAKSFLIWFNLAFLHQMTNGCQWVKNWGRRLPVT